jgi:hypothetical protein
MCRYKSPRWKRYQPLLDLIPEECVVEEGFYNKMLGRIPEECAVEGLYNKINRQDGETFMFMWRDILFIWIIFPALLFAQFHVSLALESEEDMPLSWRKLAPAILLFSTTAWLYRRNICIENADDHDGKAGPLPLLVVLLPEIFMGAVQVLASVQNLTRALDVLLASSIILTALAACLTRPHDKKSGKANQEKMTWDRSFVSFV